MIALTDAQLRTVMTAAGPLPVDKRSAFLERIAGRAFRRASRLFSQPAFGR